MASRSADRVDRLDAALPAELAFLAPYGMSRASLAKAAALALDRGVTPDAALVATGAITRDLYDEMLADHVGATWRRHGPSPQSTAEGAPPTREDGSIRDLPIVARSGRARVLHLSVEQVGAGRLITMAAARPDAMTGVVVSPTLQLRRAIGERHAPALAAAACEGLHRRMPRLSARSRLSTGQKALAAILAAVSAAAFLVFGASAWIAPGLAFTAYYLGNVALRAEMLRRIGDRAPTPPFRPPGPLRHPAPRYSVIVALYREAGQAAALAQSLMRLDWPADRLEVLLACEADDAETLAALAGLDLPGNFCVLRVPPGRPRTKPRALNHALPFASGEFLVVYDAEDRPHPLQLREAFESFRRLGPETACLQAPLEIHNGRQSWLSGMFAMEYDTLFRGMLPALAEMGGPLPLGGTSNHFRLAALRRAGGWDAWNVTEDADLGVRLARLGYACGTLTLATREEAPPRLDVWMRQRTRWFKGWIQTIAVHTRSPGSLRRELGTGPALNFHLFLAATVISAIVHPLFLLHTLWYLRQLATGGPHSPLDAAVGMIAVTNFFAGYTVYVAMANEVARRMGAPLPRLRIVTLPIYWLLMSVAAWRALWQFAVAPFHWEKTEHGLANEPRDDNMGAEPRIETGWRRKTGSWLQRLRANGAPLPPS